MGRCLAAPVSYARLYHLIARRVRDFLWTCFSWRDQGGYDLCPPFCVLTL